MKDGEETPKPAPADEASPQFDRRRSNVERRARPPSLRHDLRTPLNQILGYSEMLQEEAAEAGYDRFVADLTKIGVAARQLLSLVDQVPEAVPALPPLPSFAEGEPAEALRTPPVPRSSAPPARAAEAPARLLVVDDNELNRDLLARRLKKRGYLVRVAEDGRRALDLLEREIFDLVLLDIMMPGVSGLDVLRAVRARHSVAELPIVMATARDQGEDIVEALGLGANDYVTKPLDFAVVLARVETQLSLKRALEEIRRLAQGLEIRNRFIRQAFGRYLSDDVVESLLERPEGLRLGGENRKVTLLMADLRGFTTLTERLTPEQVVRLLNNYLGIMADVIASYQGTIDEFVGDAILALFGAPFSRGDDTERAAACAVAMQLAIDRVNEANRRDGLPEVQMGVALNTGEVIVGNIGSYRRAKYGVVGSHVNLTGRIESLTVGGQILVSQHTLEAAGGLLSVGDGRSFQTKGFKDPITVYELRGVAGSHALALPERHDPLRPLRREIPISFMVLEGKQVHGEARQGGFEKASRTGAQVRCAAPVEPLANLRIQVSNVDEDEAGDLYAKVLGPGDRGGTFLVRFTSWSPEISRILEKELAAAV
jgi:class 3 adenylate cyclase/ActR/RegA family two-component response regulator